MKLSKEDKIILSILCYVWVISWFSCIWIEALRWKLFFTGLFCFLLAIVGYTNEKEDGVRKCTQI